MPIYGAGAAGTAPGDGDLSEFDLVYRYWKEWRRTATARELQEPALYQVWMAFRGEPDEHAVAVAKRWCAQHLAFAVPTIEAISRLTTLGAFVEIGAGTGYWAGLLADAGAYITAFDRELWPLSFGGRVRPGGSEMAGRYWMRSLLLCWPPYGEPMAADALRCYEQAGGGRVVYIGEGRDGATADRTFFRLLEQGWQEAGRMALPNWPGIAGDLSWYERKGAAEQ